MQLHNACLYPCRTEYDPNQLASYGRIGLRMRDGGVIADELAVANAHPNDAAPWTRPGYVRKFEVMTDGLITPDERTRFPQACAELPNLPAGELHRLHVAVPDGAVQVGKPDIS